jgi:hypothetical protein
MPTSKMLDPFIAFISTYTPIKNASRQKHRNLGEHVLAFVHKYADFQQNIKQANSNRHRTKFRSNPRQPRLSKNLRQIIPDTSDNS